ncbi:MAG: hypothetical protein F6K55_20950 [Moorea sp. SIO4A3]|nr:hypothetical protein [Moorena sp. SIO4A3]
MQSLGERQLLMGGTPKTALATQDRAASLLKEIRRVSEQETRQEKDRESDVTPADMEMEKGDLETTEQSKSLREIEISEDGEIFNKGNYPEIRLETTAEEITSLVEPESVVPKVISIKKSPNQALLNLPMNSSRMGILPARK